MTIHLDVPAFVELTAEQYFEFCKRNSELRIERTSKGQILIMPPTGGDTGKRNSYLTYKLREWSENHGGRSFDSSTGFMLPNGAQRSPDASWIPESNWEGLSAKEKQGFPPLSPVFVAELRSPSDTRTSLQEKLREYIENGTQLAWLLDPISNEVEIWRGNGTVELLKAPEQLNGEDVLPGFILPMKRILGPGA